MCFQSCKMKQQTSHVITHHERHTIRLLIKADSNTHALFELTLDSKYDRIDMEHNTATPQTIRNYRKHATTFLASTTATNVNWQEQKLKKKGRPAPKSSKPKDPDKGSNPTTHQSLEQRIMYDVRNNYANHQLITSSMRTHEKHVRFLRHTQQRQHRNHMINKYTMYQQHEITHYGQHKTRLLQKDTKPHKSYNI